MSGNTQEFDAIIIGAGIAGMYQLLRFRDLGFSVRVFEEGSGVGGTWYWNRYPGARFDSESYSYGYSFSEELLQEWDWTEHFSPQPETLRYLNHVADKFDLRKDIQFNSRVKSAIYDEATQRWNVTLENGDSASGRFLITAIGPLSAPTLPNIEGRDSFEGQSFHTARWPQDPNGFGGKDVGFAGKRVGVIGTGATGVQVIQEVAKTAAHLTVFQRTPNFCAPLKNSPIDPATQKEIKASYPEIFAKCQQSGGAFIHLPDPRSALEVSEEEREALFERLYNEPGFGIWIGNFRDTLIDANANALLTEFIKKKIRQRVKDPETAEKLIPTNHGFGMRRVPLETNYYEVYNQDNVELVSLLETPITRITPKGVQVGDREVELDILIYATGFDAVTGAFSRIDIRGEGGKTLQEKWADGPHTYLGIQTVGFPNMFTLVGPHNGATFCNIPRCIEQNVDWVTKLINYMEEKHLAKVEPTEQAEEEWTDHVNEVGAMTLFSQVDSWFMGINQNIPNRKRTMLLYAGGNPAYREKCEAVEANNYEGFEFA